MAADLSLVGCECACGCCDSQGVIGGNGAGKSTLFKMIMDQQKPDKVREQ